MDAMTITTRDGLSYRMAVAVGEDGLYYLTFTPTDKYNNHSEAIRCDSVSEAMDKFEKNKRFYLGH